MIYKVHFQAEGKMYCVVVNAKSENDALAWTIKYLEKYLEPEDQISAIQCEEIRMKRLTVTDKAVILITDIRNALAKGIIHYNKAGQVLSTELEILNCLKTEGGFTFEKKDSKTPQSGR